MTAYYVSTTGSSSYNGLAPEFTSGVTGPKLTITDAKNLFNAAAAGDSVLFARGEAWTNSYMNLQCSAATAANPVTFGAYLHTAAAAAQTSTSTATGTSTLTDSTKSGTWTTNSEVGKSVETVGFNGSAEYFIVASNTTTVLTFTAAWRAKPLGNVAYTLQVARPTLTDTRDKGVGGADNAMLDFNVTGVDGGYIVQDLHLIGGGGLDSLYGVWLTGSVRDVILRRLNIASFDIGVYAGTANLRYRLLNSTISDCPGQGSLWGANDSLVEGNTFDNNGGDGNAAHNHNFYGTLSITDDPAGPHNLTVRGNTSLRNAQSTGTASSVAMVFHGQMRGLLIENNYVYQSVASAGSGGYGITVDAGNYGDVEGFYNVRITGNKVVNCGQNAIGVSLCVNPIIENNVVVIEAGCTFANIQGIVLAEQQTPPGGSPASTGHKVRNNTVYIDSPATFNDVSCISFGEGDGNSNSAGTNNVLSGNLLIYGPNMGAGSREFIKYGSRTSGDFTSITANSVYGATAGANYSTGSSLAYATMAAAISGGIEGGGQSADPNLVAVPSLSNGFSVAVQTGSVVINAGNATYSATRAFQGYAAVSGRDIGAYEFGSNP